uniref:PTTG1 interacting protein n=1 Tax=Callithrix jacchus TaxID=9483 RepID=A0A8I3X289_CALJA
MVSDYTATGAPSLAERSETRSSLPEEPLQIGAACLSSCSQNTNRTCEECLKNVSCLWCNTDKACLDYPVRNVLPPASLCKLSSARWGVCWVNFEALIITMSVVGGALLLGIAVCCCCCCRRKRSRKPDRSEEKAMREREERRIRQEERRAEMKTRHDEIRKKYGKDWTSPLLDRLEGDAAPSWSLLVLVGPDTRLVHPSE